MNFSTNGISSYEDEFLLSPTRMPDDIEAQRDAFRQMNKSAFVLGYTGEVGKELVKELLRSKVFSRVTLIGRRQVNYEDELYKDVVSFVNLRQFLGRALQKAERRI